MTSTQRVCFRLRVRPELLDQYRARHASVWPEMLREIEASGRRNYSLFLADDGELVGYFETDDIAASERYLAQSEVAARWEADMGRFFVALDGRADQASEQLPEVFNLERLLRELPQSSAAQAPDAQASGRQASGTRASGTQASESETSHQAHGVVGEAGKATT
ncbi:L-rhamnose mutarotase [Humibacter ginsengisoli]